MGLSSNILWHQTNIDGFKAILKSKSLSCSYSLETFLNKEHKLAFPMISLSDIPVADIGEYMEQYGGYLFGFSRQWVTKNGFNPVWYCEKDNPAMKTHKQLLMESYADKKGDTIASIITLLLYYASFLKDIEGPLHVKSKNCTYSNYRFYDEREYRFVPDYDLLLKKSILPILKEDDYYAYKESNKSTRIDISIPFSFDDLKVIIVKTSKQVETCHILLKKMVPDHTIHIFSHDEIKQTIIGTGHQILTENSAK